MTIEIVFMLVGVRAYMRRCELGMDISRGFQSVIMQSVLKCFFLPFNMLMHRNESMCVCIHVMYTTCYASHRGNDSYHTQ